MRLQTSCTPGDDLHHLLKFSQPVELSLQAKHNIPRQLNIDQKLSVASLHLGPLCEKFWKAPKGRFTLATEAEAQTEAET